MGICADPCKGSNGFQADNFTFLGTRLIKRTHMANAHLKIIRWELKLYWEKNGMSKIKFVLLGFVSSREARDNRGVTSP